MPTPDDIAALQARVQALETELHQRESMSRTVLATIPGVVLHVSVDGVIQYINRVLPEYAGAPLVGQSVYVFAPPDQHAAMREGLEQAIRTRLPSSYETVAQAPDGTRDWYHTTVGPILDGETLTGLTLICVNVSAVKRAEHEANESRRWMDIALKAGNVGAWSFDLLADVVTWSPELISMFGLTPDEAPRNLAEFKLQVPEDQRPTFERSFQSILVGGPVVPLELRIDRPDGPRIFMVQGGAQRAPDGRPTHIFGGVVDVTERRALEAQVRLSQKMDAVGQLSSGVAHNFNNMLAVIVPSLELAAKKLGPPDRDFIDDALQSALQAAALVRQLMVFSRAGGTNAASSEALGDTVRRAVDLCRKTFDRRVTVTLSFADSARDASVDGAQVEQALVNLLLNARDALLHAKTPSAAIEVAVRRVAAAALVDKHPEADGEYLELSVQDNGPGVAYEVLGRVFEPFFTTKALGIGTGLGLATVWATARAHQGFAECDSVPGAGATFRLYLKHRPHDDTQPAPVQPARPGDGQRVLVVEDEPAVARATAEVLRSAGYEVAIATSGEEGVRLAKERPIHAAILDYSMPGLSAEETLAQLRALQPNVPILSFSGLGAPLEGATVQLSKPAAPRVLLEALEKAMESMKR